MNHKMRSHTLVRDKPVDPVGRHGGAALPLHNITAGRAVTDHQSHSLSYWGGLLAADQMQISSSNEALDTRVMQ